MITFDQLPEPPYVHTANLETILKRQRAFGYTYEELKLLIEPMAMRGTEAIGSMGTDTPLAILSDRPQLLYNYFKQLFAQVTNPPVDGIREEIIMSMETSVGSEYNLLEPTPRSARQIKLKSPIIKNDELDKIRILDGNNSGQFKSVTLPTLYKVKDAAKGLENALETLFASADAAVADGCDFLILSDRGIDHDNAAMPALLAVAGLH